MARRVVVVTVEGVGVNMLGAYGGPWLPTPTLNATSSRSLVFDRFWLDSVSVERLYRSMWHGLHAGEPDWENLDSLPKLVHASGLEAFLATDSEELLAIPSAEDFAVQARIATDGDEEVSRWEDSGTARFFEESITQWMAMDPAPSLIWLHSRGLRGPWDAPYEFRLAQQGEDDPPPPRGTMPPNVILKAREAHSDELLGWSQSASAQVHVLDEAWEWLISAVEEQSKHDDYMVIFLGLQGYPLGEHAIVGLERETLSAERIHCPLWIWIPESPLGKRIQFFVHPSDLFRTIADWLQVRANDHRPRRWSSNLLAVDDSLAWREIPAPHQSALTLAQSGWSCQTPWWSAIGEFGTNDEADVADSGSLKLYVMPDDRFQQNNVVRRARPIAESIETYRLLLMNRMCHDGDCGPLPKLPDMLLERPR